MFGGVRPPTLDAVLCDTQLSAKGLHASVTDRLERLHVQVIEGRGVLVDAHTIAIGDRQIRAPHLIVAAGSKPRVPKASGSTGNAC